MANLTKTLSDDLTQGIQGIVGEDCDFCENVLVENDRCFGWERERETSLVQPTNGNEYGKADAGPRELTVHARPTLWRKNSR